MDTQEIFKLLTESQERNRLPVLIFNNNFYHSDLKNLFETMPVIHNKLKLKCNLNTYFTCLEIIPYLSDNIKTKYINVLNKYRSQKSLFIKKEDIFEFIENIIIPYMECMKDNNFNKNLNSIKTIDIIS